MSEDTIKPLTIRVPERMHREIKAAAAMQGRSMQEYLIEVILKALTGEAKE